ncbi:MAG TPA: tripartite tricarboxylate transporter substrate binding protein [Amaricoccus sp.]|uniref:Bug family tripartite tricarboxylate transporter substrate binding protein n=1 Tax=Amaricoccus sp. TaxID=1872485 RepID=UPI002C793149|nr:tripartite tricarboxylate transporter substrate binding protein [Amaricoccus sp.]HMQ93157.1 tripartite tricarboxylate transporter substrate binding protein [Amaricoccus sp.]HMR53953.1 tripartite tricarboxylate transporter substrate binding protein [Amaricoccus sp.]HMU00949.1 tripartite tricarboxylate transporter substrate binding protein [Amaricoccus sp.]
MKLNRRTLLGAGAAALALATAPMASAEPGSWSSEPVRIVVTFPPGGTSDLAARLLAQHLDTDYGQKAVVDNRPGAAGTVAADYVAQQEPDGTTLILSNNAPFTIAPTRFASIPYDTMGDFTHIAYIGASSPGLFVQPSSGITTVDEYIAASKENPLAYGSSGVGTISHILGVAVDRALGTESIHVPYQGSTPAIQDFRAGVLDTFYDMVVQNTEMIEDNEAVAIAIASPERNPEAPEVPTFLEQGYDVVLENWVGLSGPAGMDPEMTQTIHDTVLAIFSDPEVVARLTELGITHTAMSSEEYTDFVAKQIEVWAPLIEAAGIKE